MGARFLMLVAATGAALFVPRLAAATDRVSAPTPEGHGGLLTRVEAIAVVTDSLIDPSPFRDILSGYCLQSLKGPESVFTQFTSAGPETLVTPADSSWFFWLDMMAAADFAHATRFVLVNAITGEITDNVPAEWWPSINGTPIYGSEDERITTADLFWEGGSPASAGRTREHGLTRGDDLVDMRIRRGLSRGGGEGTWGILISPYCTLDNCNFAENLNKMTAAFDSMGVTYGIPVDGQSRDDTRAAIADLPDGCAKLYVYWTGHAKENELYFPNGDILTAHDFACDLAGNGADEYCVIVQTCHSGSVLDDLADKGVTGFHTASAEADTVSFYFKQDGPWSGPFGGSWYTDALANCIFGGARGLQAYTWADSAVRALRDSLVTADPIRWGTLVGGDAANPTGGFVTRFGGPGGSGTTGGVGGFTFTLGQKCSTACVYVNPEDAGANPNPSFTVFCDSSGTWKKKGTYNWRANQNVYFKTFGSPGATGKYNISMHANHVNSTALITWRGSNTTPETPSEIGIFNSFSIGWVDGTGDEFSPTIGMGTNGVYGFPWVDGVSLDDVPAFLGPEWFNTIQIDFPLVPDPSHPEIYIGGNPAFGYAEETSLLFVAASIRDPFGGPPPPNALFEVTAFQPSSGPIGPFLGDFENVPFEPLRPGGAVIAPLIWNMGTIFPEPLLITITGFGPGVIEWDAILMLPDGGTGVSAPLPEPGAYVSRLHAAAPNPFASSTTIRFELDRTMPVRLTIYDVAGRRVRTLVDELRHAGPHAVRWDARFDSGPPVAGGVYFYRLQAGSFTEARRVVRLR